jgi:hypothetical protein
MRDFFSSKHKTTTIFDQFWILKLKIVVGVSSSDFEKRKIVSRTF